MLDLVVIGPIQLWTRDQALHGRIALSPPLLPPHVESVLERRLIDGLAGILAPCILPEARLPLYTCFHHIVISLYDYKSDISLYVHRRASLCDPLWLTIFSIFTGQSRRVATGAQ